MKGILIAFVSVIVLVLAFVVVRTLYSGARYAAAVGLADAHSGTLSLQGKGPQMLGPYTIHGTAIMDNSHGTPAVPYIEYLNTNNSTTTKQLVYIDPRACAPGAGDYPCVPTYSASTGYPQLTTGQPVTVTGYIYENRFLITSISKG